LPDHLGEVSFRRVDRHVCSQLGGGRQPGRLDLGRDDLCPGAPGGRHVEKPDGPRADDDDHRSQANAGAMLAVHHAGEGFGERGCDQVRRGPQAVYAGFFGNPVLGKAVPPSPYLDPSALVGEAPEAGRALGVALVGRVHHDRFPHPEPRDTWADLLNPTGEFVSQDHRQLVR
jgi:hypothetical protein